MDEIQQEKASMREEIDYVKSKIDQIIETLLALARREDVVRVIVIVRNDAPTQIHASPLTHTDPIPNFVIYDLPPGFTPLIKGTHMPPPVHTARVTDIFVAQGLPIVNQISTPRTDEEIQDEFEIQNYNGAALVVIHTTTQDSEAILMCRALAEKLGTLEGHNTTRLSALEMCLVLDVVIPPKLKAPEFDKYNSLTCPNIHLKMYCRKMVAYATNDKLMIHWFQDKLTEASLYWYMQLECNNICTWDELDEAFAQQYKYNTGMAPNHTQL
ncbi:uncharacterized protein LOC127102807 [Lathyrus oleraceus]|uniref:uncharacterized protein LOC127102807 n=1 Tax=Pisum sativum TaxID=3888 RepID=UPI0021D2DB70|nr:uncharacterized protein LOC127102807 [Pisum sativum]